MQELKNDIKCLDKKLDKNEENMNKRLEKNEENMNRFMEVVGASISKLTEAMTEMKLAMVKDYVEKEDLEKVEVKLTEKIDQCNDNRKQDIKILTIKVDANDKNLNRKIDTKFDEINKDNNINVPQLIKKGIEWLIIASLGIGGTYFVLLSKGLIQ